MSHQVTLSAVYANKNSLQSSLTLAPLAEAHAGELFALIQSDRDNLEQYLYWTKQVKSVEDTKRVYILPRLNSPLAGAHWFSIFVDDRLAGVLGVKSIDEETQTAEIGYWLHQTFGGQGVMTRAVKLAIDWLYQKQAVRFIEIQSLQLNHASIALAKRIGAKQVKHIKSYVEQANQKQDLLVFRLALPVSSE